MKSKIFPSLISKEYKEFLNLLDLTAKVHGEPKILSPAGKDPVWQEDFFHIENSATWKAFSKDVHNSILHSLGNKIYQEAYFIECAGMAYAAKMNLASKTREERAFFCFVAEEEAKHLRLIESLGDFSISSQAIPSFALLIGEIIQEANRSSHLLLIQILLEGWGLTYYKSLSTYAKDPTVVQVFKQILKDEIRHHSAGVLLFSQVKDTAEFTAEDKSEFLAFLERIAFMVKVGPWNLCEEVFKHKKNPSKQQLKSFLEECAAVKATDEKMLLLETLLDKNLPSTLANEIKKNKTLMPLNLDVMTETLFQSMPGIFLPE